MGPGPDNLRLEAQHNRGTQLVSSRFDRVGAYLPACHGLQAIWPKDCRQSSLTRYIVDVARKETLSRSLLRRAENPEDLPLTSLQAISRMREHLDGLEEEALKIARARGATYEEIAGVLGITRQAVHYKARRLRGDASESP